MPISTTLHRTRGHDGPRIAVRAVWVTVAVLLAARLVLIAMASFWDAPQPLPPVADAAPAQALPEVEIAVEAQLIAAARQARDAALAGARVDVDAAFARAAASAADWRRMHYSLSGHYAELRAAAAMAMGWPAAPPVQAQVFAPLAADLDRAAAAADRRLTDTYLTRASALATEVGVNDAADDPPPAPGGAVADAGLAFADAGWHAGPAFRTAAGALVLWVALAWAARRLAWHGPGARARALGGVVAGALCWAAADSAFLAADDHRFGDALAADLSDLLARQHAAAAARLAQDLSAKADRLAATTIRDMRDENG